MSNSSLHTKPTALQKFKKNPWGVVAFLFVAICSFFSIFAYLFAPDASQYANNGELSLTKKNIGFEVEGILIPSKKEEKGFWYFTGKKNPDTFIPIQAYRMKGDTLHYQTYAEIPRFAQQKTLVLPNTDYTIVHRTYWLGTDNQGRDYLSRLLIGSRISLSIGFVAVAISLLIGILLGAIAGYFGGKIDALILWLINVMWSIPTLLLVIAMTLALGKGFWQVFIAVGLTMWVEIARVVRGQVISLKEQPYITAAKALGYGHLRIIGSHILPNVMAPVIVISAANFAAAILVESGLSFLGLGAQVPIPSWGGMIKENYNAIILGKAHLALLPGIFMCLLVLSFMIIGNTLRDALDVKTT